MSERAARVLAVACDGPQPVEVIGSGPLADELRASLPIGARNPLDRPGTIVTTAAGVAELQEAFRRVRELGLVVLAGEVSRSAELDLYADVHVRGLTVVGVAESFG